MLDNKELKDLNTIYNFLLQVKTDVVNSYIMADGMRALQEFIQIQEKKKGELENKEEYYEYCYKTERYPCSGTWQCELCQRCCI